MRILGVSCYFHDAAAALLCDGVLVAAADEERFSRVKHDYGFPERAIRFCLDSAGVRAEELDYVAFFEKPLVKFERLLQTAIATVPRSNRVFREAMTTWLLDKLWIKTRLKDFLGVAPDRILFAEHHESHAASAFFCSPFEEAAILTVDGVGEWATTSIGRGSLSSLQLTQEIHFPHSLGLLYSAFTAFLGFEVNEGEYKVMGMAPYGVPRFVDEVRKLITVAPDGAFALDLDYFSFHHSPTRTFNSRFERLFGAPRPPETPFFTQASDYPSYYGALPGDFNALALMNQRYADIAASVQAVTEDVMVRLARTACQQAGVNRLCIAGGVGLNSVANARILRDAAVDDLFIQPAAGDGGAALGAALFVQHAILGEPRRFVMDHAYWGASINAESSRAAARASGHPWQEFEDESQLLEHTVETLESGKVVGWCQGAFEWGPRALGHRSILADPRRADMKDLVNVKIKFREPYRPFAPSVTTGAADTYFDLPRAAELSPARFMLLVAPVRPECRDTIPAVTHVDGSARLQTVNPDTSPRYHALIEKFGQATGVPVLLNTSFNLRGEPIVNTPEEAISTFQRSGMDALVIDRVFLTKRSQ